MQEMSVNLRRQKKLLHKCEICNKYCKSEFCLKIHKRCHKECKTGLYKCSLCHLTFTRQYVLNSHFNCAHSNQKLTHAPGSSVHEPHCMCCKQKFSALLNLKKQLKPNLFQFSFLSKWLTKIEVENHCHAKWKENVSSVNLPNGSSKTAPTLDKLSIDKSKGSENNKSVTPLKVLIPVVAMERIDGKLPPQGSKKKLATILPRPNGAELSVGKSKLPVILPRPDDPQVPVFGKKIPVILPRTDNVQLPHGSKKLPVIVPRPEVVWVQRPSWSSTPSHQGRSTRRGKRKNVSPDQNHQSASAFDSEMGDGEFISLIAAAFKDDTSDDDSDSSGDLSFSNDHPYAQGKFFNEDEVEVDESNPLDDEKMRQFLHTHSSVDRTYGVYRCLPCRSAFSSDTKLLDHLNCHLCHICGNMFEDKQRLLRHLKGHKSSQTINLKFDPTFIKDMFEKYTDISEDGKLFSCTLCSKDFSQRWSLFIHMYSHARKLPTYTPKRKIQKSDPDKGSSTDSRERTFHCPQCDKSFFSRNNLRGHMEIHEETQRYLCSICGKGFRRRRGMLKHLQVHAKGDESQLIDFSELNQTVNTKGKEQTESTQKMKDSPVPVNLYKKQLPSSSGQFVVAACFTPQKLRPDQKPAIETRERVYPCPICNKPFYTKANVRGHMEVHKAKKYECSVCNRSFRRKLTMERHVATHR